MPSRERRNGWIKAGIFARLNKIVPDAYDRIVGFLLSLDPPAKGPSLPAF
jgi:hypothetical protein